MKKIGFLSFGHWTPSSQSQTRSAADTLLQSIELAVAAEELGADGAYFRVHHFARQLASPFPLLAAVGAKGGNSSGALAAREKASGAFRHHTTINGESFFSPGHAEPALRDRWQNLNKRATDFEQNRKVAAEPGMPEDL
jgi:hypothetical protein